MERRRGENRDFSMEVAEEEEERGEFEAKDHGTVCCV